jgi:transcriptional regulator with GAF, ATPase, and Fis domain
MSEAPLIIRDELAAAVADLSQTLLEERDLGETLKHVVDLAVAAVPGCSGSSVTLLDEHGTPSTAVSTSELVDRVDQRQYEVGEGPCLDAARKMRQNLVDLREADDRWPDFTENATKAGFKSFLATPLMAGGEGIGALNLYSIDDDGFDRLDTAIVDVFAAQASVALANAQVYARCRSLTEQLTEAMASRAAIEQAKGALMATQKVDEDAAFDLLRQQSQRSNQKLRDVAVALLATFRT